MTMSARQIRVISPKLVVVGSTNPVKIEATQQAFDHVWPDQRWRVEECDAESGVSSQPMSLEEGFQGATNRATQAQREFFNADYVVGIEEVIHRVRENWFSSACVVVIDRQGQPGLGISPGVLMPAMMMRLILDGKELDLVDDWFFGQVDSKQSGGHYGLMSKGTVTSLKAHQDGLQLALARFINPPLF